MNPVLQEILHNITTRLAALEESAQSEKLLVDLIQEQRAEIDRLRQALAQSEQESVAWRNAAIRLGEDLYSVGPNGYYDMTAKQWLDWALSVVNIAQPKQEPVAWIGNADFVKGQFVEGRVRRVWWECNTGVGQPLYTEPPRKEWVGLTEGELIDIQNCNRGFWTNAAKIEQLLKDKNT